MLVPDVLGLCGQFPRRGQRVELHNTETQVDRAPAETIVIDNTQA